MAGFIIPQPLKAALKLGIYGPAGSGKTFTSLLIAEGLAKHTGKQVAYVDTEHGTAFYAQSVPQRSVHPDRFDFHVLHSKSITECLAAVRSLDLNNYGVLVIDSISHLWDSCKNAYAGKLTSQGGIPLHAWSSVKKPYKELLNLLLSLPVHVLICGRQGLDYGTDEESGELKNLGFKMRAEGETAYEPDVLLRMEYVKQGRKKAGIPVAHVEKDRTGILAGQSIDWPAYDNVALPLLGLLGTTQAPVPSDDEVGMQDADALARQEWERQQHSAELAEQFIARFTLADGATELQKIGKELTPAVKKQFVPSDLENVRKAYADRLTKLKTPELKANGAKPTDEPTPAKRVPARA